MTRNLNSKLRNTKVLQLFFTHSDVVVVSKQVPCERIKYVVTCLDQVRSNRPQKDEEKSRADERVEFNWIEVEIRTTFSWEEKTIEQAAHGGNLAHINLGREKMNEK
jgi:hypothetical protein